MQTVVSVTQIEFNYPITQVKGAAGQLKILRFFVEKKIVRKGRPFL